MTDSDRGTQRRDAVLLGLWMGAILSTLELVRPMAEALRGRGSLGATVVISSLIAAGVAALLLRDRPGQRTPVPVGAAIATVLAAGWLSLHWVLPEERIHLAMYGPVGVLAWRALGGRTGPALLLGIALGGLDEAVQGWLPSRTFDALDVLANGVAASAGVLLVRGGRGAWGGAQGSALGA